jgi:lysine-N-methylase
MKLPVLVPGVRHQRFECRHCTECCRDLVVHITAVDRQKLDRQDWPGRLGLEPYVALGRALVLNHKPGGGCVFLTQEGLCRIHAEHGATEKPLACQLYPFTVEWEGAAVRTGIRFDCPSVARNVGMSMADHRKDLARLVAELQAALPSETCRPFAVELVRGKEISTDSADSLVERIDSWLREPRHPLEDRLTGLWDWISTLRAAKLNKLGDEQLRELAALLADDLPNAVAAAQGAYESPPTAREMKLFRQGVFAHCEHITLEQARAPFLHSLVYRWGQVGRARRMGAGQGPIPQLIRGLGGEHGRIFAELGWIGAASGLEGQACDELMTRYLRGRILARNAFGPGYYGWPMLDGLTALLLAAATVGWLSRYAALVGGRDCLGYEDLVRAIGVVDRNAGRVPELGARTAGWRVRYLMNEQGLLRLLRTYRITAIAGDPQAPRDGLNTSDGASRQAVDTPPEANGEQPMINLQGC